RESQDERELGSACQAVPGQHAGSLDERGGGGALADTPQAFVVAALGANEELVGVRGDGFDEAGLEQVVGPRVVDETGAQPATVEQPGYGGRPAAVHGELIIDDVHGS